MGPSWPLSCLYMVFYPFLMVLERMNKILVCHYDLEFILAWYYPLAVESRGHTLEAEDLRFNLHIYT